MYYTSPDAAVQWIKVERIKVKSPKLGPRVKLLESFSSLNALTLGSRDCITMVWPEIERLSDIFAVTPFNSGASTVSCLQLCGKFWRSSFILLSFTTCFVQDVTDGHSLMLRLIVAYPCNSDSAVMYIFSEKHFKKRK